MNEFANTRWSLVLASRAGQALAHETLVALCHDYRPALLGYALARGYASIEAEDLTHRFLDAFTTAGGRRPADARRGSFRRVVSGAMRAFITDEQAREREQRLGPGLKIVPVRLPARPLDARIDSPERQIDRLWGQIVVQRALARQEAEAAQAGRLDEFMRLAPFLSGQGADAAYEEIGAALRLNPNTVAITVYRLRQRFRLAAREEIADTVSTQAAFAYETRALRTTLGIVL